MHVLVVFEHRVLFLGFSGWLAAGLILTVQFGLKLLKFVIAHMPALLRLREAVARSSRRCRCRVPQDYCPEAAASQHAASLHEHSKQLQQQQLSTRSFRASAGAATPPSPEAAVVADTDAADDLDAAVGTMPHPTTTDPGAGGGSQNSDGSWGSLRRDPDSPPSHGSLPPRMRPHHVSFKSSVSTSLAMQEATIALSHRVLGSPPVQLCMHQLVDLLSLLAALVLFPVMHKMQATGAADFVPRSMADVTDEEMYRLVAFYLVAFCCELLVFAVVIITRRALGLGASDALAVGAHYVREDNSDGGLVLGADDNTGNESLAMADVSSLRVIAVGHAMTEGDGSDDQVVQLDSMHPVSTSTSVSPISTQPMAAHHHKPTTNPGTTPQQEGAGQLSRPTRATDVPSACSVLGATLAFTEQFVTAHRWRFAIIATTTYAATIVWLRNRVLA